MKINVVSYATGRFLESQKILERESYKFGANKVFSYQFKDLNEEFKEKNRKILSLSKGAGYWLWKPHVILETFKKINDNEILIYLDSGMFPINNLNLLLSDEEIISFEMFDQDHINWTKFDCFHIMNCLEEKFFIQKQRLGGFQIYKKTEKSIKFVEEYLHYCENYNYKCIDDSVSIYGKERNCFKENRHDQSVFTNLCIKHDVKGHRDPSQWGNQFIKNYDDKYPQIFYLHRGNIG